LPEHPDLPGVYTPGLAFRPGETEPRYITFKAGPVVTVTPGSDGPACAHCNRKNLRRYVVLRLGYGQKMTLGVACSRPLLWHGHYLTVVGAQRLGLI